MSNVNLKISRVSSNKENDYILVEITDDNSRIMVASLKLSLSDFANIITGRGDIHCQCEYGDLSKIGKTKERKNIPIYFARREYGITESIFKLKTSQYEIDGWIADWNSFNSSKKEFQDNNTLMVPFYRWI